MKPVCLGTQQPLRDVQSGRNIKFKVLREGVARVGGISLLGRRDQPQEVNLEVQRRKLLLRFRIQEGVIGTIQDGTTRGGTKLEESSGEKVVGGIGAETRVVVGGHGEVEEEGERELVLRMQKTLERKMTGRAAEN